MTMELPFKMGLGFDLHATQPGGGFRLGGCEIPASYSLRAHSDGDLLVHALIDAMLGALALGSIGDFFPDSDPRFCGADSMELLRATLTLVRGKGYRPSQLDAIVIAETPKLSPHLPRVRESLSRHLGIPGDSIGLKAKTSEGLGPVGEGRALEARCIVVMIPLERV